MTVRLALTLLICLTLALPAPWSAAHMLTSPEQASATVDQGAPGQTGISSLGGCHEHAANGAGGTVDDAPATEPASTSVDGDCCQDGCDCGCVHSATVVTSIAPTRHATPGWVAQVTGVANVPAHSPRLLRPPIARLS